MAQPSPQSVDQRAQVSVSGIDVGNQLLQDDGLHITGLVRECTVDGCRCTRQGQAGTNCPNRLPDHAWHGHNLHQHVMNEHMDFRDVCPRCGATNFSRSDSFSRHVKNCRGGSPVRCKVWWEVFPAPVALGGHVLLGLCPGPPITLTPNEGE